MTKKLSSTKTLGLAAAWSALGANYESVDRSDPKHQEFTFSPRIVSSGELASIEVPTQDLDVIEAQWVNKTLQVNAVEYYDALQRLKSLIHSK